MLLFTFLNTNCMVLAEDLISASNEVFSNMEEVDLSSENLKDPEMISNLKEQNNENTKSN